MSGKLSFIVDRPIKFKIVYIFNIMIQSDNSFHCVLDFQYLQIL